MKNLKKNAIELAEAIAIVIDSEAKVSIWQNRRLYVNYTGMPKAAQNGGYVDLATGKAIEPYKARTGFQKQANAAINQISGIIFE